MEKLLESNKGKASAVIGIIAKLKLLWCNATSLFTFVFGCLQCLAFVGFIL